MRSYRNSKPSCTFLVNRHLAWSLSEWTFTTFESLCGLYAATTLGLSDRYLANLFKSFMTASVGGFIFRDRLFTASLKSALSCARNCETVHSLHTSYLYNVVFSASICGNPADEITPANFFFSACVLTGFALSSCSCLMIISACLGSAS